MYCMSAILLPTPQQWNRAKPYVAVTFMQFGLAGVVLLGKDALNHGLNHYSFVVYRHIVAFIVIAPFALVLERKTRPKMTIPIFTKIMLLALFEPVMDQNLYFMGIKETSATFATSLGNILPALTFIMALIFRLEKVELKNIRSQAKIAGTLVTVGGAMVMTLVRGPIIPTPWNNHYSASNIGGGDAHSASTSKVPIKGALMILGSNMSWASYVILQAITIKSYPAELSLTALMCALGSLLGLVLALVMERGNTSIWAIHLDIKLLVTVYAGLICSGIGYYLQAVIMRTKGPVFVTAFSPLIMVIVAILSSIFLSEILSLGSLLGAIVIVTGLYLVIWGKSKDSKDTAASTKLDNGTTTAHETVIHVESPKVLTSTTADGTVGRENLAEDPGINMVTQC